MIKALIAGVVLCLAMAATAVSEEKQTGAAAETPAAAASEEGGAPSAPDPKTAETGPAAAATKSAESGKPDEPKSSAGSSESAKADEPKSEPTKSQPAAAAEAAKPEKQAAEAKPAGAAPAKPVGETKPATADRKGRDGRSAQPPVLRPVIGAVDVKPSSQPRAAERRPTLTATAQSTPRPTARVAPSLQPRTVAPKPSTRAAVAPAAPIAAAAATTPISGGILCGGGSKWRCRFVEREHDKFYKFSKGHNWTDQTMATDYCATNKSMRVASVTRVKEITGGCCGFVVLQVTCRR